MKNHTYYIYITTNSEKTVLYIGVTNNLVKRLNEHYENRGKPETFAGKYYCYNLVYWEVYQFVNQAISREKELKKWRRGKKDDLINSFNPEWKFLNDEIGG
jgi:putative endonuclease